MKGLPTTRAAQLASPQQDEQTWLIEGLWSAQAVGIIGGEPKCGKSFLALDLAVSVASGTPCLRRFPTRQCGAVLLFAAEDALHIVRGRLEGIAAALPASTFPRSTSMSLQSPSYGSITWTISRRFTRPSPD